MVERAPRPIQTARRRQLMDSMVHLAARWGIGVEVLPPTPKKPQEPVEYAWHGGPPIDQLDPTQI